MRVCMCIRVHLCMCVLCVCAYLFVCVRMCLCGTEVSASKGNSGNVLTKLHVHISNDGQPMCYHCHQHYLLCGVGGALNSEGCYWSAKGVSGL